jgi:hypothetical protein
MQVLRAAVRGNFRRGVASLVLGLVLFVGTGLLIGVADDRQERLEAKGERVQAVVTDADNPPRGPNKVTFRYEFGGQAHEVRIVGSNAYSEGEMVTAYVDPERPWSATLRGEQPQSRPAYYLSLALVVLSLTLLGVGVVSLWRAWREF